MTQEPTSPSGGDSHRLTPLVGRDRDEEGRQATPLELLFDLSFVVAFGIAGEKFAHAVAHGHLMGGLCGLLFAAVAVVWCWINHTWFSSAYDNDDWLCRLLTMLQMVGVVVLALGLKPLFASLEKGGDVDNRMLLMGYVVMRTGLLISWARAWRDDRERRREIAKYIVTLLVAQVGWTIAAFVPTGLALMLVITAGLLAIELAGPALAERDGDGTPWHAHHMTERYGLLTIICLGETVIGTVTTLATAVDEQGWSTEATLVVVAGLGLTFGMWWLYFAVIVPEALHHRRERSFAFAYLHLPLLSAIVATGAGLHLASYLLTGDTGLSTLETVLAVVVPVAAYIAMVVVLYYVVVAHDDRHARRHAAIIASAAVVLGLAALLSARGLGMGWSLLVLTLGPLIMVVGYEADGHRHVSRARDHAVAQDGEGAGLVSSERGGIP